MISRQRHHERQRIRRWIVRHVLRIEPMRHEVTVRLDAEDIGRLVRAETSRLARTADLLTRRG